ncbi:hypothetical protein [Geobacillus sp. LEMMY01]|uniref:hypothetical protein n=1 Tax=Geobacillus sp. LEMMY01 TaxID=1954237 RepID=UPI0009AD47D9|nr:hypothetical protein [Geobacillus sp. LEMMY01]OPX04928.1 hypothetical protein B1A75_01345 [Geobacillus sp. LEMMY01]
MNLLPGDLEHGAILLEHCKFYVSRAYMELQQGDVDAADRWIEEYQRCRRELDELLRRKREHDQLAELIATLQERGINITTIIQKGE